MTQAAVFLDKDGTLIDDVPYNVDPERVTLARGAGAALRRLALLGFKLVVVSNQPGIALRRFDAGALTAVERRIQDLLEPSGVGIDAFYYCPHLPASPRRRSHACDCRKPQPGMLRRAAHDHGIELERSWLVGDILDDVEAGNRAGCRSILLVNGNETEWRDGPYRAPAHLCRSLPAAALLIAASVQAAGESRNGIHAIRLATRA